VTSAGSGEGSCYTWVDQFDTLGLGENVPINTGNQSEGLLVLKDGKWVVLRVPYPMTDIGGNHGSLHNQVFRPTVSCE
jgi:hypothetical protein